MISFHSPILADLNLWIIHTNICDSNCQIKITFLYWQMFILNFVSPHLTCHNSCLFAHWREYIKAFKNSSFHFHDSHQNNCKWNSLVVLYLSSPVSLIRSFQKASVLTRLSAGWPRLARRVTLMWLFFSSQFSICFTLVVRSWAAMPCEKVSSFTCTGAAKGIQSAPFQILHVHIEEGKSLFISNIWYHVRTSFWFLLLP